MLKNGRGESLSPRLNNEIHLAPLSYIAETLQLERESTHRQTAALSFGPSLDTLTSATHRSSPTPPLASPHVTSRPHTPEHSVTQQRPPIYYHSPSQLSSLHQQMTNTSRSIRGSSSYDDSRPSSPMYGSYNPPALHQQSHYNNHDQPSHTHASHGVNFMLRDSGFRTTDNSHSRMSRSRK